MSEDTGKKWDDSLISMGLGALVVVVSGILLFNYFNNQTPQMLRDQGQKSVAVSSTMPSVTNTTIASASATAQAVAQKITTSPKATATVKPTPTVRPTATVKATATPAVSPTGKPSESPKASTIAQSSIAPSGDAKTLPATYTVQSGDSLWGVSQKFYGSGYEWKQIASANNISGSYRLATGQVLTVPKVEMISATSTDKSQVAQATPGATSQPTVSVSPTPAVGGATISQQNTSTPAPAAPQGTISYTVVSGDNLWNIASEKCNNGYAWSSIANQNKLAQPGVIHAGNLLTFTCS